MDGLIPARAGNTYFPVNTRENAWAHPRSRGEHPLNREERITRRGSSPLARGTLVSEPFIARLVGLIPARAGNTHSSSLPIMADQLGSSPLARGTPAGVTTIQGAMGLIPARAGNTAVSTGNNAICRAHPRSRGEHSFVLSKSGLSAGSSPLARGTQVVGRRVMRRPGLIPARAGNTDAERHAVISGRAHPRSRGEHITVLIREACCKGSSPLARGTRNP